MRNFNKIIDLEIKAKTKVIMIKTPRHGIKPQIKVSGNLTMGGFCSGLNVELTNFYYDGIGEISEISVQAGYEDEFRTGIKGCVQTVVTDSPGPDKVTVISCVSANLKSWQDSTINLKLNAGFSLNEAVSQLTAALGFERAEVDSSIAAKVCAAPLEVNGKCSETVQQLKIAFPDVNIFPSGNKLVAVPKNTKRKTVLIHTLPFITQAPQYTGGAVTLTAPWNPMIKPGDYVKFPNNFKNVGIGALVTDTMEVVSIQFCFATATDENEMTLTGTVISQLKEA